MWKKKEILYFRYIVVLAFRSTYAIMAVDTRNEMFIQISNPIGIFKLQQNLHIYTLISCWLILLFLDHNVVNWIVSCPSLLCLDGRRNFTREDFGLEPSVADFVGSSNAPFSMYVQFISLGNSYSVHALIAPCLLAKLCGSQNKKLCSVSVYLNF